MPHQSRASIPVRLRPRREIGCLRAGRQQPVIELEPAEHPLAIVLREEKLVKDSLKQNILEGRIQDISVRERYHTIYFQTTEGKILFEILIPNYAFRNLNLSVGKMARIALREESLWVML